MKIIKLIFLLFIVLVAGIAAMAYFSLCPPAGPWPTPPWCSHLMAKDFSYHELDYLKLPAAESTKFKLGVGTMDIWGNPHWFINLGEDTTKNYASALKRIGQIKSQIYFFTDFINLGQGSEVKVFDRDTFAATYNISESDLKSLVASAKANNQNRIIMLTNLSDTKNEIEGFISSADKTKDLKEMVMGRLFKKLTEQQAGLTSAEGLKDFDEKKWQEFLASLKKTIVAQATKAQAAGVTDFIVNPGDVIVDYYYPNSLSTYWQSVRTEVKSVFSGRVGFFGYPDLIQKADLKDFDFVVVYFEVHGDKTAQAFFVDSAIAADSLKLAWQKYFAQNFWKNIKSEKILLVTIPSYTGVKTGGWIEPGEMHSDLIRDDREQAWLYETLFEILQAKPSVDAVISYGYWWSPNMYPQSQPLRNDLSHSLRGKDAENVFYFWANNQK
ncbi:MAG: hypothetical protein WCX71_01160 [Candidatus Buchananbacteria bacterium]